MVQGFIFENFCRPIIDPAIRGYNPVNTLVYAAILFALVFYFVYPFLKKREIKADYRFILALLPYIFFGSAFRVLNDLGLFQKTCSPLDLNFYTFTPGIWLLTAGLAIFGILAAKRLAKSADEFYKYFGIIGAILFLPILIYEVTQFKAVDGFILAATMVVFITLGVKVLVSRLRPGFFSDKLNSFILAGQVLDGSATFVATSVYRCGEQHPLSASILGVNPVLFIVVKVAIALLLIYFIDRDLKDKNYSGYIKMAAIILGWAPGTRDLLTIAVGTCL